MSASPKRVPGALIALVAFCLQAAGAPVAAPIMDPDGGAGPAPLKVAIRSATPGAVVHVTYDGSEPTQRDAEVDADSFVLVDEPLILKARAWLPDGSVSDTKTARFALQPLPGNAVSFLEQNVPSIMAVGRAYKIGVTLHNIGKQPWARGAYSLLPNRAADARTWTLAPTPLAESTPTWADATFAVKLTAPAAPGTYSLGFRMAFNGQPFGEPTPSIRVVVLGVEDFEREMKTRGESGRFDETASAPKPRAASAAPQALSPALTAALQKARAASTPAAAASLERLVGELRRSPRSFQYLRTRGFGESDEAFEKLIATHGSLFRSTRIIRRDEKGQRIIPGWPAIALTMKYP